MTRPTRDDRRPLPAEDGTLVPDEAPRPGSSAEWPWAAVAILLVAAPAAFWGGGVIEEEALGFLRNYWGDRPVLARIFDPRGYDFYQARELSYAIDFLDAQWVRLLISRGVLFFVPPSALLAGLAVVAIGVRLVPRALPDLDRATRWLILLVFLANFAVVSTTGLLYRATKPLVAPILLALLLLVLAEHRRPRLGPRAAFSAVLGAGLVTSLLDRQGLFYVGLLTLALCAAWVRTRRGLALALGGAAALLLWLLYNHALGPWIIHSLNGYWPEMRFQRLRPERLLDLAPWLEATRLLGDWARVLLGGLPPALVVGAASLAAAAWAWRERRRPRLVVLATAAVLAGVAAQLAMVATMVQRHAPVAWIDHRAWYYPLPFQAVVVFGLLWGLARASARSRGRVPVVVPISLAALVVLNVSQWPERRQTMESGPWFSEVARRSALLVRSWRLGRAELLLDGDYRRFYFETLGRFPRLGERARPQVAEGEGFDVSGIRDGRVVARAGRTAHLVARAGTAGRYRMAGHVFLRAGDHLTVALGSRRLLAELKRDAPTAGVEHFRVTADLAAGENVVLLLSRLPEEPGSRRSDPPPRAFGLALPVVMWPATVEGG